MPHASSNSGSPEDHPFSNHAVTHPAKPSLNKPSTVSDIERRADDVLGLVDSLSETMSSATQEIHKINSRTKLLALNARIEAARAGAYGAAFSVVASEMQQLAGSTAEAASQMTTQTQSTIAKLIDTIGTSIKGKRLADMALVNIDLIDRNLYERSCDVRWWATDASAVDALTLDTRESAQHACKRLGTILNSYTVYWDIVLCNARGKVIANGRTKSYASIGQDVSQSSWFINAMKTGSGEQFAFESAHRSHLVNDELALVYSAAIRRDGEVDGAVVGVLGVIFNWSALADSVMKNTPIDDEDRDSTRLVITEENGNIVADSMGHALEEKVPQTWLEAARAKAMGFKQLTISGREFCVGFARAPGYETYSTNWYSFIAKQLSR